jgi:hypothetical protein
MYNMTKFELRELSASVLLSKTLTFAQQQPSKFMIENISSKSVWETKIRVNIVAPGPMSLQLEI